jgi:hypothetical protein
MPYVWSFTLLDDAYFVLNRAKSMTDTPSAKKGKGRFIRSSVLFSWQALEEATKSQLKLANSVRSEEVFREGKTRTKNCRALYMLSKKQTSICTTKYAMILSM